jgi:hypothetical protein
MTKEEIIKFGIVLDYFQEVDGFIGTKSLVCLMIHLPNGNN